MTPPVNGERVVHLHSGEIRCPSCAWAASMTGDTEDDVTAFLRARWQEHVAELHRTERPS
jgi:hypothetical protein